MPSTKKDDGRTLVGEGGYRVVGKKRQRKEEKRFRGQKARELDCQLETKQVLKSVCFQKRKE